MEKSFNQESGIEATLRNLEGRFSLGDRIDGPGLAARALPSDMHIAGYEDDRKPNRKAAVLIPLVSGSYGPRIVFTKRPEGMKVHPGQISFPGGRHERADSTLEATALREAREEVGLDPEKVEIVGRLAPYKTITRFEVTPIIGLVSGPFTPVPDPVEVEEVFDAPLAFFLDPENLHKRNRMFQGKPRPYYYFDYKRFHIWGATAAMLINFREAIFAFTRETP